MSVSSLFSIGLSSMQTVNQLLNTTEHNISNINTPGYSLQTATLQSIPTGAISTTGSSGNGVQVTDIKRIYSSLINSQLNLENSNLSYWNNYQTGIAQVENLFNEASNSGISPDITSFFADWQNVAQSPQDQSQRTALIQQANDLTSRLSTASSSLQSSRSQLLTDSQSLANQVNSDTAQIANLNMEIAGNSGALDLQDQRDQLLQSLNQIVKVSTFQDNNGMVSVMLGGTPLVQSAKSYNMSVTSDTSDTMHFYVTLASGASKGSSGNPEVTSNITGGQLKANLQLRDTDIPNYSNQLNAFAVNLANFTNYYQKQGYDLNGSQGGNFFTSLSELAKYTSVDSSAGIFTTPSNTFTNKGGTLTLKLGDNDTTPVTVNIGAGSTLQQTAAAINAAAGSKVTATVVNLGPATKFTVNSTNNTFKTEVGAVWSTFTVPAGTYTGEDLATAIGNAGAGINAKYDGTTNTFTITPAAVGGATQINFVPVDPTLTNIGGLIGFSNTAGQNIGAGISGSVLNDYRISIKSNPDGNLGQVRIGVSTTDGAGSGLNLLANSLSSSAGGASTEVSLVSVTNPTAMDNKAQYKIDYVNTDTSNADPLNFANVAQAFNIAPTNNVIEFKYNNNSYTATLKAGNYTGAQMAAEIANEMNAATKAGGEVPPKPFTVTYSYDAASGGDVFGISSSTDNATINWGGSTVSYQQFGFQSQSSITGGAPATEGAVTYGSYQPEVNPPSSTAGIPTLFWQVMKSDDGSTWTALNPNTSYNSSNSSALNESEVNLAQDYNASTPSSSAYFTRTLEFEGIKVQIDGNGSPISTNPNGETFDVQLDPNAASDIATAITDPNQVAASTDTFTVDSSNNTVAFNLNGGTTYYATIPAGSYTNDTTPGATDDISAALKNAVQNAYQNATGTVLPDALNVVFNPNTKQFKVMMTNAGTGGDTINLLWNSDPASTAKHIFGFSGSSDTPVAIGTSAVSDDPGSVLSSANTGVPGDNRNATTIANLATGNVFGGTTPVDFYNSLVSNIGVKSASAKNNQQYTTSLVQQLTQRQTQVSGVSMDQEAANLVMYEKSYQAAAQMIQVANTLMTTLLQIIHN